MHGKFSSMGNLEFAVGSILNWLFFFFRTRNQDMIRGVTPVGAQQLIGDLFVSCSCRNIVYAKLKPRQCISFAWMGYLGTPRRFAGANAKC